MSPYRARPKGPAPSPVILALALACGVGAAVGALWLLGAVHFPWDHEDAPQAKGPRRLPPLAEGRVRVILSPREIPAFTQLDRDLLLDQLGQPRLYIDAPAADVTSEMLTSFKQVNGRVLARDKAAGFAFTERDLLPSGTRPGLVAGVPPGKVAMRLPAEQVPGLYGLHLGDRFDVIATQAVDTAQKLPGVTLDPKLMVAPWEQKQARVRTLVSDGVVVQEPHARQQPTTSTSLLGGARTRAVPVVEVVVAVAPDEVGALSEALALEEQITVLVRSGRSDDLDERASPDRTPRLALDEQGGAGGYSVVETINGEERAWQAVPSDGAAGSDSPPGAPPPGGLAGTDREGD